MIGWSQKTKIFWEVGKKNNYEKLRKLGIYNILQTIT